MSEIPIEFFLPMIAIGIAMIAFGKWKETPLLSMVGASIIAFLAIDTTIIHLGKIPDTAVTVGDTTTYTFIDNDFIFTQWHKIFLALIGSIFVIDGALDWKGDRSKEKPII